MARGRGKRLNAGERKEMGRQAYELAIRRATYTEIGKLLDISRYAASKLVREEQQRRWAERDLSDLDAEKKRAIASYDAVISKSWRRLERLPNTSLNVSGLFNVILTALKQIDAITGIANSGVGDDIAAKAQAYLDLLDANTSSVEDMSE